MPTSLIAPVVGAGVSFGLNKLFAPGGGDTSGPISNFRPTGFNAGGLSAGFDGTNFNVSPSAERLGMVGGVANTFGGAADAFSALRARVAPGISELRANRLNEIENARTRSIGDLRDNLQRRRVLGSSFGTDAIARAENEFGGARERVAAESTLQELELTQQFTQQEFAARRQQFQTGLDELNLEANIASGLTGKATDTLGQNARLLSQLNMLEAQNAGRFFGQTFGPAISSIGKTAGSQVGSWMGSGGSGGSGGFGGSGSTISL